MSAIALVPQNDSLTSRASNDALEALRFVQVCHFVVSAAQLEAKDWLEVLALQQDSRLEPIAKIDGMGQGGLFDDLVDARGEDESQVLLGSQSLAS